MARRWANPSWKMIIVSSCIEVSVEHLRKIDDPAKPVGISFIRALIRLTIRQPGFPLDWHVAQHLKRYVSKQSKKVKATFLHLALF
jgi:hypothetical protein